MYELRRNNELLEKLCLLVGKMVNSEAEKERKPRRTNAQLRQLKMAMEALKNDPLHNVLGAAKYAYKHSNGYKSLGALHQALNNAWQSRVA